MKRLTAGLLAVVFTACTPDVRSVSPSPAPVVSPTPTPTPSPSPSPDLGPLRFESERAVRTIAALSRRIGPREDADPRYARAADLIAEAFTTLGYSARRQRIPVPSGSSDGVAVPAGTTQNVIGEPPGFDETSPHLLVGAHLDTVASSPGANDNASGVAVLMELARLARISPTAMPIVWVAFGGEERRRPGFTGTTYGSRHYLSAMSGQRRAAVKGVVALDVVGRGSVVYVCSGGRTKRPILAALSATAKRLGIASRERVVTKYFSDHAPFERAGIPVGWLWTGEYSQVHTRRDTLAIIQPAALERSGRLAWETLRALSL